MKHSPLLLLLIGALVVVLILAVASTHSRGADAVTPDFEAGYCLGWQQAVAIEAARYENWRKQIVGDAQPSSGIGVALRTIADSIPAMMLLPPNLGGKFTLADGRVIDCAPKEPPK